MEIFASMAAAREHYARRGFTHERTRSGGRVTLLHPAGRAHVHLAPDADGRVRSLRVVGPEVHRGALRVQTPGSAPDAHRGGRWPLRRLLTLPFIVLFAAYGLVLALVLIGCDHLPGLQRSA